MAGRDTVFRVTGRGAGVSIERGKRGGKRRPWRHRLGLSGSRHIPRREKRHTDTRFRGVPHRGGGMEGNRDGMNGRSTNRVRRQKCGREWRIGPDKSTDRTRSRPSERNPTGVGLTLALPPARKAKKSIRWLIKNEGEQVKRHGGVGI
ncbi:hypothetical protein BC826DRAFT_972913 [Russula brevipes]|nr:hypothetical protein BC826DRAFT_972913 [Russula brevipes]